MGVKERIGEALEQIVRGLYPGYYALVMATGIISIAMYLLGFLNISRDLFVINVVTYVILCFLTGARFWIYPAQMIAELTSHAHGPTHLTFVAATAILGSQFVLVVHFLQGGLVLWLVAFVAWFVLFYTILTSMVLREQKPFLAEGLDGGWLLFVVAVQSLSVLGSLLAAEYPGQQEGLLLIALCLYLLGCLLYLIIIILLVQRLLFVALPPQNFTPPYWITMGAAAITTLAGATLILNAPRWSFLIEVSPFLKGSAVFYWVSALVWIPLLIIIELWRYLYTHLPLRYDPQDWAIVFPLGMYSTCTYQLFRAGGLAGIFPLIYPFLYLALLAWILAFGGLLFSLGGTATKSGSEG